jgi:hypothetical protein
VKRALVVVFVACASSAPPPPPPVAPKVEAKTPPAEVVHGITITPKAGGYELGDGKFTIQFPDKPRILLDTRDGRRVTAEAGTAVNHYSFTLFEAPELKGNAGELPFLIQGIFAGLEASNVKQAPWRDGIAFEGTVGDGTQTWPTMGWTVGDPKAKRIYLFMIELPNGGTLTKQDGQAIANTLKLL